MNKTKNGAKAGGLAEQRLNRTAKAEAELQNLLGEAS